jgi:competence protein ComEC
MSSTEPKPSLTVLDVGHGSAAVLRDSGGVVIFDTGRGPQVLRHLQRLALVDVQALFLSHADADHIGGAATLLLHVGIRVSRVFLNPDPTKKSPNSNKLADVFQQLIYAIAEAEKRTGTVLETSLTTNTKLQRNGATVEVLFPPATTVASGVGGADASGNPLTSNSMSAAFQVSFSRRAAVLLGGDVEFACLDEWRTRGGPRAHTLVFPDHGGLPGDASGNEAALFAHELAIMVQPEIVVFSIHRTRFGLPRDEVVSAVLKAVANVRFLCTQLPARFVPGVARQAEWSLHRSSAAPGYAEGDIQLEFNHGTLNVQIIKST